MKRNNIYRWYKWIVTWCMIAGLMLKSVRAQAQQADIHLGNTSGYAIYNHHLDLRNHCLMVRDLVLEESGLEDLLADQTDQQLIDEMRFFHRWHDSFEMIGSDGVVVDYSSLFDYRENPVCPIVFSYDDGSGIMSITAYVYVLPEEEPVVPQPESETETSQTETETEPESQTESEPISEAVTDSEESTSSQDEPETVIITENNVISENAVQAANPETESHPDETPAAFKHQNGTEPGEDRETDTEILHALDEPNDRIHDMSKSANHMKQPESWMMDILNSSLYFGTFSLGSVCTILYGVSIFRDLKILKDHQRKVYQKLIKRFTGSGKKEG